MLDVEGLTGVAKGAAEISRAVVGHDPLDGHPKGREPGDGALEEGHGTFLALVRQDLGVGEARGVVDADMQEVPADPAAALGSITGEAMTGTVDPVELLDGELNQLTRLLALVADHLRLGVEGLEPAQPAPAQDDADGGDGPSELAGDGRAGSALAAQRLDLGLGGLVQAGRAAVRPRRALGEAGLAFGRVPVTPLANGPGINPHGRPTAATLQPSARRRISSNRP